MTGEYAGAGTPGNEEVRTTAHQLGTLERVNVREAWANETNDFTPWLSENLDRLSDALGMAKLELEGTEVLVDTLYADIVARIPQDGTKVLIENQLEDADLQHLGQVLAYLAGLKAQIAVWVAKDFPKAHLTAVRWLNEHTADPFAFFAVKVSVVRIGDSQRAPVFDVLARPDEWDRQVQEARRHGELSERGKFCREFWTYYAERYADDGIRRGYADTNVYHYVAGADLQISQYIAPATRGIGVYIAKWTPEGESSESVRARVKSYEAALRTELGIELGEPSSDYLAISSLSIDSTDRDNWLQMVDWLHEKLCAYRRVLTEDVSGQPA